MIEKVISYERSCQAGIVLSLILVPIRSGLRGFYLFVLVHSMDYRQKKPLKEYPQPDYSCNDKL